MCIRDRFDDWWSSVLNQDTDVHCMYSVYTTWWSCAKTNHSQNQLSRPYKNCMDDYKAWHMSVRPYIGTVKRKVEINIKYIHARAWNKACSLRKMQSCKKKIANGNETIRFQVWVNRVKHNFKKAEKTENSWYYKRYTTFQVTFIFKIILFGFKCQLMLHKLDASYRCIITENRF